ncbi:2OG-Fe(II) oxygenase [Rhodovulum sp. DZ06]|uniref:2OG-Fe(II) oxygenase n=1 Tax=Rhodovulum sp. DZ06 TaxID=3425126 RepID=UPI003D325B89
MPLPAAASAARGHSLAPLFLPALFSPSECARICAHAAAAGYAEAGLVRGATDPGQRRARIAWPDEEGDAAWVFTRIMEAAAEANRTHFDFALDQFAERMQVAEYDAGDLGHFDWHMDLGAGQWAAKRKLTFVAQLSAPDAYEGGTLELNDGNTVSLDRAIGSAVLFPSFMLHRVTPVTAGTRRSLTLWVHGPAFR